ncbi:hypothetical protein EW146_g120 [Bondarzewia mesenterica]|uniref:MYND-type domain-containing protein n=1 Tax=Bondarzewia mesenterica TaxID=1095465 RepID=A0A4S4M9M2_9AGAM|nr:hypothetical protein EW146_g120 [Bondarzewia mesenterica]
MATNLYNIFLNGGSFDKTPEQQFVSRLVENQIAKLEKMDLGDLTHRDYTLKIVMNDIKDDAGNDRIWRQFRVSGGISVAALADKVITPLMGWVRNYHAHAFTESKAIDMMHSQSIGYDAVPEKSDRGVWTLAHLLQKEGEIMLWLYDYGDNWRHIITASVEDIAPASESTGKVAVLDGCGACPREDGSGNETWVEDMAKLRHGTVREKNETLQELQYALNYKGKTITVDFDPDDFDLFDARARVRAALASPDSVWSGPKTFVRPLHEDALKAPAPGTTGELKRGQKLERTWDGDEEDRMGRFMQEVTTQKRDKKNGGCCWNCGSPHNLAGCSRCHRTLYCGTECQREHWKAGHRQQCGKQK